MSEAIPDTRCRARVWPTGAFRAVPCARAATTPSGFCWQHDPRTIERRRVKSDKRRRKAEAEAHKHKAVARYKTLPLDVVAFIRMSVDRLSPDTELFERARDLLAKIDARGE